MERDSWFHLPEESIEYEIPDENLGTWVFSSLSTHLFFYDNPNYDYSEQEHIFIYKENGDRRYIFNTEGKAEQHMQAMMGMGFDYTIARRPSEYDMEAWLAIQDQDIDEMSPQDLL